MKRWAGIGIGAVTTIALLILIARRPAVQPPATKLTTPPSRPMVQIVSGQIEARRTVSVELARTIAIEELVADVGQDVAEGQVLARLATASSTDAIASALLAAQTKAAGANADANEARLEALKAKGDAQRAKDQAAQASLEFTREQKLMEIGATPRQTFERAQRELEAAKAESAKVEELSRLAENLSYATADRLREANAAVAAANKSDAQARAHIAAAEIHAPVSGTVVWRKSSEDTDELFRIAIDRDQLRVVFPASKIKPGRDVLVTVTGLNVPPIHARVTAVEGENTIAEFISPNPPIKPGAPCTVSVSIE